MSPAFTGRFCSALECWMESIGFTYAANHKAHCFECRRGVGLSLRLKTISSSKEAACQSSEFLLFQFKKVFNIAFK